MILLGDLFDVLPTLDAASVDSCVTDPPYELAFMGKRWDASGVAFKPETWAAVLRVLKPGAHLVAFGGTRTSHRMVCAIEDAGFEIRDSLIWMYGQGFPKSRKLGEGWGTALKPGHEPIVLARKPFKGSITANHQQHGVGGLNVDACRIEAADFAPTERLGATKLMSERPWNARQIQSRPTMTEGHDLGRWPANVLLDEEAAQLLDEQSGELVSGGGDKSNKAPKRISQVPPSNITRGFAVDAGGASRFFYVAKPSREERDYGCERNIHPTVKPVALMRWLVRLVTPLNGTVLDPFMGSGTTGMACRYEQRQFIGIEREAEYVAIAEKRIAAVCPLFDEVAV